MFYKVHCSDFSKLEDSEILATFQIVIGKPKLITRRNSFLKTYTILLFLQATVLLRILFSGTKKSDIRNLHPCI